MHKVIRPKKVSILFSHSHLHAMLYSYYCASDTLYDILCKAKIIQQYYHVSTCKKDKSQGKMEQSKNYTCKTFISNNMK